MKNSVSAWVCIGDMKKILIVGAEALPFAATGGLGDVLGSLPAAIARADSEMDVRVVMPLHSKVSAAYRQQMTKVAEFTVRLAWRCQYCGVYSLEKDGVIYYFIDNEFYFRQSGVYGDGAWEIERYAFFCKAVADMMEKLLLWVFVQKTYMMMKQLSQLIQEQLSNLQFVYTNY